MAVLANSMRLQTLISYRNQLEMRLQGVTEDMSALQSQVDELLSIGSDLDPDSETLKELKIKKERLNLIEKKLEVQQKQWQAKLEAVNQEIQGCEQNLSKSIEAAYTNSLAGR